MGINGRQILIVDDDSSIRTLLRLVAERRGYSVDVAADGVEALRLLSERRYDLAIIDLMMPRVNGYELVDGIRRFEQRPTIVIATAMTDSLIGLLDAEIVHSIIRKPFDIEMLGALMSAIVDSKLAGVQSQERESAHEEMLEPPAPPPPC
ncbi:MAG TPA: response regulator [Thermoanaerobaculia bacterium]|nr:response regulator [Thermoanaerobaculia bacterium]